MRQYNVAIIFVVLFSMCTLKAQTDSTAEQSPPVLPDSQAPASEQTTAAPQASVPTSSSDIAIVQMILSKNNKNDWKVEDHAVIDEGRIVILDLNNKNFGSEGIKEIPTEIAGLTELTVLKVNDNDLTALPEAVCSLKKLKVLEARSNSIASIPDCIGDLSNLQELDLRSNDIESLPPSIGRLKNLEKLKLWSNKLTTLPAEIGNLAQLKELYLKQNRLTSLPQSITKLKIWYLDIMDNKLCFAKGPIDAWLKKFDDKYKSLQTCLDEKRFK